MLFDGNYTSVVGFAHARFDVCQFDYCIVIFNSRMRRKTARKYVRKHSLHNPQIIFCRQNQRNTIIKFKVVEFQFENVSVVCVCVFVYAG